LHVPLPFTNSRFESRGIIETKMCAREDTFTGVCDRIVTFLMHTLPIFQLEMGVIAVASETFTC